MACQCQWTYQQGCGYFGLVDSLNMLLLKIVENIKIKNRGRSEEVLQPVRLLTFASKSFLWKSK